MAMKKVIGKKRFAMAPTQVAEVKSEDPQTEAFTEMENVFSAAANIDAIKIFYAAKNGISNSTEAIKELDLTQKRYYTHLKRLIEAGLIEKDDGAYRYTTLGKISYKLGEAFTNAISQRDRLDLVDRLTKAKNITLEETEEIMRAILKDTNIVPGERISDLLGPVRMSDTWDKVVQDVVEYIDDAQEEVYFATQYLDMKVVESLLKAAQRNVHMKFLVGELKNVNSAVHVLLKSLLTNHKQLKFLFNFVKSPELQIRHVELPYTFVIVDGKYSMVEVAQPYTKSFSLAFFFHNEKLSERLKESFETLWENASEVSVLERFVK
jgi:DNA-binding MarR family transcriptional regulator